MKYVSKVVAAAVLGFTLAGCTGTAIKSPQYDSSQYTVLGRSLGAHKAAVLTDRDDAEQHDAGSAGFRADGLGVRTGVTIKMSTD